MADRAAEAERELREAAEAFHAFDRALPPDAPTPDEWHTLMLRRDAAIRRAVEHAPDCEALAAENRADVIAMDAARLRIGRQRTAALAGRMLRLGVPAREVLGLCLDRNRARGWGLKAAEIERVARHVIRSDTDRLEGRA